MNTQGAAPATHRRPADPVRPSVQATATGLLRAAWRVHRNVVFTGIAVAVVLIGLLTWFRVQVGVQTGRAATLLPCLGADAQSELCRVTISDFTYSQLSYYLAILRLACLVLAAGGGLLIGASSFAHEFEQHTQVFALTQSTRRLPWWAAKVAVTVIPMTLTMLAVAATANWAVGALPYQNRPMEPDQFYFTSEALAVIYLVAVCAGIAASIVTRSTLAALAFAAVVAALLLIGGEALRPHLAPADRELSAPTGVVYGPGPAGWNVGDGMLDANDHEVDPALVGNCSLWDTLPYRPTTADIDAVHVQCAEEAGVVSQYTDRIPPSRFWLVHTTWSALLVAVSAAALAVGATRIRRRIV